MDKLKLLSRNEVADYLKVTLRTFDNLRKQGGFAPHILVGKRLRWRVEALEQWLHEQEEPK